MSTLVNWVIDTLASEDIIDLYFILSDLADIEMSEAEMSEMAYFDAMASETDYHIKVSETSQTSQANRPTPMGKMVL